MTVHHLRARTEALASMRSTPLSVSAQTAGRAASVMLVSMCRCVAEEWIFLSVGVAQQYKL